MHRYLLLSKTLIILFFALFSSQGNANIIYATYDPFFERSACCDCMYAHCCIIECDDFDWDRRTADDVSSELQIN